MIDADLPLADVEFVAFDTETTGCAGPDHRVVEIGAVRFRLDGTELGRYQQLINPRRSIPSNVIRVHGITPAMVVAAPDEAAALPDFLAFLGDSRTSLLMAHNAGFDLGFLSAAIERSQLPQPTHRVIDTVRLSRKRNSELSSHSLANLVRSHRIGSGTEHRALSDALALSQVFLRAVARPPALDTVANLLSLAAAKPFGVRSPAPRPSSGWSRPAGPRTVRRSGDFGLEPVASDLLRGMGALLSRAIDAGQSVRFVYDGGSTVGESRRVTPLRLFAAERVAYLLAYCPVDRKQKQYRVDRIREFLIED